MVQPLGQTTRPLASRERLLRLDPRTGTLQAREYVLELLSGPSAGRTVALNRPLTCGSSPQADLPLDDPTVSRLHLELRPRSEGVTARDLGSTNGTYIAGVRVQEALIEEETTLVVGTTRLRIRIQDSDLGRPAESSSFGNAVAVSRPMQSVFGMLGRVAASETTVLLLGETGTGKEVLARGVHEASARRGRPFVVVDCGAMAASLIESELFGHVRGSFTGATTDRTGAFQAADGGTLFLDEVGELPLELQPKLLRVLEAGMVKRVGEDRYRNVDVRLVAATHRDLEREVEAGRFRKDLFFRLAVVPLRIPSLRERPEDVALLARRFAEQAKPGYVLPALALDVLAQHAWPGNVRELRNTVERAVVLYAPSELERLDASALASALLSPTSHGDAPRPAVLERPVLPEKEEGERNRILDALRQAAGNQTVAAKLLGISRGTLLTRLDTYDIPRPRKSARDE